MKRTLAALAILALTTASCSDGPTQPEPVLSVSIYKGPVQFEEETIAVGQSVQLTAQVEDERGNAVPGHAVRWTSADARVAEVDGSGRVTGHEVGTTVVVAATDRAADSVRINVGTPVSGAVACAPGAAVLGLSVGGVHATNAYDAQTLCLGGGDAGAEYVLVPFYASAVSSSRLTVDFASSGLVKAAGPPNPLAAPAPGTRTGPTADDEFHLRLHERTRSRVRLPLRPTEARTGLSASRSAAVPKVGDELRFNVETDSDSGCSDPDFRTGRVVAVSRHAVVVADVANPANGYSEADYVSFGSVFDELVYPVNTGSFGEPTDIDDNDRAVIFFTRAVNELTPRGSGSYIGGFFYNRDLFSRTGENSCAGSNQAEIFYMMVPDPRGEINGNVRSRDFVQRKTVSVLAHEFHHLINDSRRLLVNAAPNWEEKWLSEGLSHIAEELVFYQAAGLRPGMNLDPAQIRQAGAAPELDEYVHDNLQRLITYLTSPSVASLMGTEDDLPTRGAAWAFLRYAADRRGGDERALWATLVRDTKASGIANLRRGLGAGNEPVDWMQDWSVAVYTDDAALGVPARFTQPSWNYRALIPGLADLVEGRRYASYPLRTLDLAASGGSSVGMRAGGAAYLRFGVPAAGTAAVRTTVAGGLPGPTRLRLAVVRTR